MLLDRQKNNADFMEQFVHLEGQALLDDEMQLFPDEIYENLSYYLYSAIPASIQIKYLRPIIGPGQCYSRSWLLTMAFDKCFLVRGDLKDYGILFGKNNAGHGWVEADGWVYDPTSLYRYKKDLYYEMHRPKKVVRIAKQKLIGEKEYQRCADHKINKQLLLERILVVYSVAQERQDNDLINDIAEYLKNLGYENIEYLIKDAENTFWDTIGKKDPNDPRIYAYYQKNRLF